jgi:DNA repair protein SbcD/Mre11
MTPFTFVHAADLHIGSPFKGVTAQSPAIAQELRDATLKAFENIINLCIESQASFLVLAGDVYDGADRSIQAQLAFLEGLNKLSEAGISTYIAHGNHDPLDGWCSAIELPARAHVFSDKVETLTVTNSKGQPLAFIAGISYRSSKEERNLAKLFGKLDKAPAPDLFRIGVLHCNVGHDAAHANYAPCTAADLIGTRMNYWALGHVHERKIINENPWIAYPGNSQGRHVREPGARGCYVVKVLGPADVQIEFQATDAVRWLTTAVSIQGLQTINELEKTITIALDRLSQDAQGRPFVCRLSLQGRGALYHQLQQSNRLQEFLTHLRTKLKHITPFRWLEQLDFDCAPEIDVGEVRRRNDVTGFVLREAEELAAGDLKQTLLPVLAPLFTQSPAAKYLGELPEEQLRKLLEEASMLCFDKLENS